MIHRMNVEAFLLLLVREEKWEKIHFFSSYTYKEKVNHLNFQCFCFQLTTIFSATMRYSTDFHETVSNSPPGFHPAGKP